MIGNFLAVLNFNQLFLKLNIEKPGYLSMPKFLAGCH